MPDSEAILGRWAAEAATLQWDERFRSVYEPDDGPGQWFVGGTLNAAVNCLDRHLEQRGDQIALHWEGEPEDRRSLTYRELHAEVAAVAAAFVRLGVGIGDRVALYLSWLPETVVAMLACARIGAVHVLNSSALPASALANRLAEVRPRLLVTQDGAWRHGLVIPLKARADEALAAAAPATVEHTLVLRRTGIDIDWYEGDRWYHEETLPGPEASSPPKPVPSDHPLLVAYVANRRGRATGLLHRTAGVLTTAGTLHRRGFTYGADDVLWCACEVAWVVGQANGVYGPLTCGATTVMFEGMLDTPGHGRAWEIIERYGVTSLLTTPVVMRRLREWTDASRPIDVEPLRLITTAGEPVDPRTKEWMDRDVASNKILVAEMWGQTELAGAVTIIPSPQGPDALPDPGFDVVDDDGHPLPPGARGELVIRNPWPGAHLAVCGAERDEPARWTTPYTTSDWAIRTEDGGLVFAGRRDELVNLSGQLVSLSEVAEVLAEHPFVGAVEVVRGLDDDGSAAIVACVVPAPEATGDDMLAHDLASYVKEELGGLARLRAVVFVESFPPELSIESRRQALELLCGYASRSPRTLTAAQLAAAAGPPPSPKTSL
jgi:acetyl-CoA synthetase